MITIKSINPTLFNVIFDVVYDILGFLAALCIGLFHQNLLSKRIASGAAVELDGITPEFSRTYLSSLLRSLQSWNWIGAVTVLVAMVLVQVAHPLADAGLLFESRPTGDTEMVLSMSWNAPRLYWWTPQELVETNSLLTFPRVVDEDEEIEFDSDSTLAALKRYRKDFVSGEAFTKDCIVENDDSSSPSNTESICTAMTGRHNYDFGPPMFDVASSTNGVSNLAFLASVALEDYDAVLRSDFPFSSAELLSDSPAIPVQSTGISTRVLANREYPTIVSVSSQDASLIVERRAWLEEVYADKPFTTDSMFYSNEIAKPNNMYKPRPLIQEMTLSLSKTQQERVTITNMTVAPLTSKSVVFPLGTEVLTTYTQAKLFSAYGYVSRQASSSSFFDVATLELACVPGYVEGEILTTMGIVQSVEPAWEAAPCLVVHASILQGPTRNNDDTKLPGQDTHFTTQAARARSEHVLFSGATGNSVVADVAGMFGALAMSAIPQEVPSGDEEVVVVLNVLFFVSLGLMILVILGYGILSFWWLVQSHSGGRGGANSNTAPVPVPTNVWEGYQLCLADASSAKGKKKKKKFDPVTSSRTCGEPFEEEVPFDRVLGIMDTGKTIQHYGLVERQNVVARDSTKQLQGFGCQHHNEEEIDYTDSEAQADALV